MANVKAQLTDEIRQFVKAYQKQPEISTDWGEPLVGFADAYHPYIQSLKTIVSPTHGLPQEILPQAKIVLVWYVPFTRELAQGNAQYGHLASPQWALAYEETNAMLGRLSAWLTKRLAEWGYQGIVAPATATFDSEKLVSDWSHRHFAYAAGLGTFGLNNMLITRRGCCGRYFSMVTDLAVPADAPMTKELCLYKANGTCGVCVQKCPAGALTAHGYDRKKCYALLRENAAVYRGFGSSYTDESGENANSAGSEVCGKCVTASPCMLWKR